MATWCQKKFRTEPKKSEGPAFASEADLVRHALNQLARGKSPWGSVQTVTEWNYRSGVTDILARTASNQLIALEAKLTDWRGACHQAYRNTTFAAKAYVVLPQAIALRVQTHEELFRSYGVGLCSCGTTGLSVLIESSVSEPLMDWLAVRAHTTFDGMVDGTRRPRSRSRRHLQAA